MNGRMRIGFTVRPVITEATFNRHYANLLLSELLYKNDYAQTNHPALRQAVAYFDSLVRKAPPSPPFKGVPARAGDSKTNLKHNLAFLAARAHYINGVGYYENDSAVLACTEYIHTHKNRKKYQKLLQHRTEIHTFAPG